MSVNRRTYRLIAELRHVIVGRLYITLSHVRHTIILLLVESNEHWGLGAVSTLIGVLVEHRQRLHIFHTLRTTVVYMRGSINVMYCVIGVAHLTKLPDVRQGETAIHWYAYLQNGNSPVK